MNVLQLRTRLSLLDIKWTNLPPITNFTKYNNIFTKEYDMTKYRIIGYKTPIHPKYNNAKNYMDNVIYFISNNESYIYISLGFCCPFMWYSIKVKEFDDAQIEKICSILQLYDIPNYIEYDVTDHVLFGNVNRLGSDINQIQSDVLETGMIEYLMWGSKYKEYPYERNIVCMSSNREKIDYVTRALNQKDNIMQICCRTLWSKSLIKINKKLDYITLDIYYNSMKYGGLIKKINKEYNKNFPLNLPIDIVIVLMNYPYINHKQLINDHNNIDEIVTMLNIIIPHEDKDEFINNIEFYCDDEEKIESIKMKFED
jgi:hypothetical protein